VSLLLDTHVVLWWLTDDATLADEIKDRLDPERIRDSGFRHLHIAIEHSIAAGRLPLIHRDPFDRMLVAQAQLDDLTLVTRDAEIQKYDVDLLVV
jgi:PIN domain nuclease of toxin-antitoxin system